LASLQKVLNKLPQSLGKVNRARL